MESVSQYGWSEHGVSQKNAHQNAGKRREQGAWQCPAGLFDAHCHEIDRHGLKDSFGTTEHDRDTEPQQGICTVFLEDVECESGGGGGGKQLDEGDR